MARFRLTATALAAGALTLTGCGAFEANNTSDSGDSSEAIAVSISDTSCDVAVDTIKSGTHKFTLSNKGSVRNEFEILAEDQLRIVGERENLGPGTSVDYTVTLEPGTYYTACKKNMVGSLVDARKFTVEDSGKAVEISADEKQLRDEATANYTAYIKDQTGQLVAATKEFTDAYTAGDFDKARQLYPTARQYYERIEPTAESFGDIDPKLDEREADYQEADDNSGREWTGWHVLEKDLWRPDGYAGLSDADRTRMAGLLTSDTQSLYDLVYADDFSVSLDDISNGAIGLLEEVATSKITGEEEAFSHTDLWDFQANVEGAQVAYGNVQKLAQKKNADLAKQIESRFKDMSAELDKYKSGDGYKLYDELSASEQKELAAKVNALRKPLAQLTEAILK